MRRREFIGFVGGAAAWPFAAQAILGNGKWRVGYITPGFLAPGFGDLGLYEAFMQEMESLGYVEGNNLTMEKLAGEGQNARLAGLAKEIVASKPAVIVAVATPAIAAVQQATSTIPIVMSPSTDPIGSGFVKSLARPGGNITGIANLYGDSTEKVLDILRLVVPAAKKIAVLMSSNPTHPHLYDVAHSAAARIGISTVPVVAAAASDLQAAFKEIKEQECEAVYVLADPIRPAIVSFAAKATLPDVYQISDFVDAGGLASYGSETAWMFRRAAHYVDKLLKGADPSEMPVEQPTMFKFVINLKTAKSLNLSIPESVIFLADRVIE